MYEGGHVRFYAPRYLLQPQRLEGLLNLGEAALDAVEVGAGRYVEDIPYAKFVQPLTNYSATMNSEVVPK